MTDRSVRNLVHLRSSASTARVLNLLNVYKEHGDTEEWAEKPMFRTPALNRSMIIKHRLRRDELDAFPIKRQVATKIVIPIDTNDLRTGGRFLFVGQRHFERLLKEAFGMEHDHPDIAVLRLLDRLPSLDPFLLREQLKRNGVEPAPCYLAISESDMARMIHFVEEEIRPLVTLSLGGRTPTRPPRDVWPARSCPMSRATGWRPCATPCVWSPRIIRRASSAGRASSITNGC